jgi:hypothetical protein
MVKAEELIKQQKEREDRKFVTFDKIYKLVEKKICFASSGDFYHTWYEMPEFLVGLPMYSRKECHKYIINKLLLNGFETEFYEPNILLIKWAPKVSETKEKKIK